MPLDGFEDFYEVSDLGRVRSLDRMTAVRSSSGRSYVRLHRGRLLTACAGSSGYLLLSLSRTTDDSAIRVSANVHDLVLGAFAGPRPPGLEACHGPGGNLDNRLVNLSWGTHAKNTGPDKLRDGTLLYGSRHSRAKLTEEIVRECRMRYAAGESAPVLAREFEVNSGTMWLVVHGKTWRHVDGVPA